MVIHRTFRKILEMSEEFCSTVKVWKMEEAKKTKNFRLISSYFMHLEVKWDRLIYLSIQCSPWGWTGFKKIYIFWWRVNMTQCLWPTSTIRLVTNHCKSECKSLISNNQKWQIESKNNKKIIQKLLFDWFLVMFFQFWKILGLFPHGSFFIGH